MGIHAGCRKTQEQKSLKGYKNGRMGWKLGNNLGWPPWGCEDFLPILVQIFRANGWETGRWTWLCLKV